MLDLVAQKDNHVNLYNKYLLLLEYTDQQGSTVCDNRSGRGPEAERSKWMPGEARVAG
jgi:hypothetical protein